MADADAAWAAYVRNPTPEALRAYSTAAEPRIETAYDPKPIPSRAFDWSAVTSNYEPGQPVGYGATEAEAIRDLRAQLDE